MPAEPAARRRRNGAAVRAPAEPAARRHRNRAAVRVGWSSDPSGVRLATVMAAFMRVTPVNNAVIASERVVASMEHFEGLLERLGKHGPMRTSVVLSTQYEGRPVEVPAEDFLRATPAEGWSSPAEGWSSPPARSRGRC